MRIIYMVLAGGLLLFTSCNSGNAPATGSPATTETAAKPKAAAQSKLSAEGTQMLLAIVQQYYGLKNALVTANATHADSAATQIASIATNFQAYLAKDPANGPALKPYIDTILTQSKQINNIKDETCEKQRIAFDYISRDVYAMLKNVDLKSAGIYHEYCPMAFNERGAYWLSDEAEIKNPYFGKKMLECGEVSDSL